ncbi:MAG: DUF3352 domain-containing protein [Chloroflexi bacterium]|nr:DUF3352 domain-containing protein [Chloroflexota bacterium]
MSFPPTDPSRPAAPQQLPEETTAYQAPPTYPAWSTGPPSTSSPAGLEAPPQTGRRGGPIRWVVAIAVTLIIAVAAAGLAIVAIGARTTTAVGPSFLPASTVAYMDVRLDFPGDQRDRLVELIGHFPGFDDPANFDLKINDALDKFLGDSSGGRVTYTRDIKPWFTGEVSIGLTAAPDVAALDEGVTDPPVVIGLGVSDRAALDRFIVLLRIQAETAGATFSQSDHAGATIVSWDDGGAAVGAVSFAVTDDVLLIAMAEDQVRLALDVRSDAQPSLADAESFKGRMAALPAERLGAVYLDLGVLRQALEQVMRSPPVGSAGAGLGVIDLDRLPTHLVAALRAEGDRVILDTRLTPGAATPALPVRTTTLAERMPATTVFYAESRDVGRTLEAVISQLKAQLGDQIPDSQLRQVEEFLGTPVEDFLSWVADTAVGVSMEGDQLSVGMAATVTDEAVAIERVARLSAAISAVSLLGDAPFVVDEEAVGGARLTTISFDPAAAGTSLPADLPFTPSLSYAVHEGIFYLGLSDFVRAAVVRAAADSLASTDAYRTAVEAAGGVTNSGLAYLDIASIRQAVERYLPPDALALYEDRRPYIEPLDRLVVVGTSADADIATRMVLFVE